ncbi:MAG: TetR/AcrR family transcriptional regulator [Bacteroidaceae bacterium]
MPLVKTRTHLVDVSRKLFARVGYEHTTMNDIALASRKGRRTLYTYFKSKEELYWAVVESELDILTEMMRRVAVRNIDPDKKIIEMIFTRLDAVKEVVYRNGTLRANFFRDIWAVEKVRKKFDFREVELFELVLREGVSKGFFSINDTHMTAVLIHYCVKGIEVPHIRGQIAPSIDIGRRKQVVADMVLGALHRPEVNNEHFIEEQLMAQQQKDNK